ncbi:MAG: hypothetical protein BWK76_27110 [Desulfobulbaceae bacterium A2]|nr:MAG: hypothetical protein BWK76_27110 [Desulfobulbaceae bacterium A2]
MGKKQADEARTDHRYLTFLEFIRSLIKQLDCEFEQTGSLEYVVTLQGGDRTGVSLKFNPAGKKGPTTVTAQVEVDKRCLLPFSDTRFFRDADDDDETPKFIASLDSPKDIGVLVELVCKGVYFQGAGLRSWKCSDCGADGYEIFSEDGSVTTVDEEGDTFYLFIVENLIPENEGVDTAGCYDEQIDEYVFPLCEKCRQVREGEE